MVTPVDIGEIASQAEGLVRAAYERGFADGGRHMRESILAAVSASSAATVTDLTERPHEPPEPSPVFDYAGGYPAADGSRTRAPRGLIDEVLDRAVSERPGLQIRELEREVLRLEPRIGVKSIYNRLRHLEMHGRKFRRVNDRWYLGDRHPLYRSPAGETSGASAAGPQEDPQRGFTPEGGSVGAHPEAGGTC